MVLPRRLLSRLFLLLAPLASGSAQTRYEDVVRPILDAWKTADVVCLGEDHGRYFDSELRIALVRHPSLPRVVQVIVVEFASPVHQDLLDRFIVEGAPMSREDLAPIWRDANGAEVWESPIYEQFLRAVQDVNLRLPSARRIRVLGGGAARWAADSRATSQASTLQGASGQSGRFPEASERKGSLGLGAHPAYVIVNGTRWASLPANDLLEGETDPLGQVLDAIVYHGDVSDSVVRADLTILNAKYGPELARRGRLIQAAFNLWQRRP